MSVKIWTAYRVPIKRLNEYLGLLNEATRRLFLETVDTHVKYLRWSEIKKEMWSWARDWGCPPNKAILGDVIAEHLDKLYQEASAKSERSYFDMDAGVNIWLDQRYAYFIPVPGIRVRFPKTAYREEYSYQNSTDRPQHISARAYDARGQKWDTLCLEDHNRTRLWHHIISFEKDYFDSSWLLKLHFGCHPSAPGAQRWTPPRRGSIITAPRRLKCHKSLPKSK